MRVSSSLDMSPKLEEVDLELYIYEYNLVKTMVLLKLYAKALVLPGIPGHVFQKACFYKVFLVFLVFLTSLTKTYNFC